MSVKLSNATLSSLPETVNRPAYDRSQLRPGILHFGIGNFHRAHQALYLDDLFNQGEALDWGIVGAGVLPSEAAMRDRLVAQDLLTTVVEQDNNHTSARVIGPMVEYLPVGDGEAIKNGLSLLAQLEVRSGDRSSARRHVARLERFYPGTPLIGELLLAADVCKIVSFRA